MEQPKLNYSSQCQLLKPCLNIKAGANFDALLNMKKYISGSKGYFASKIVLTYCEKNCSSDKNTFWLSVSHLQIGEITITMCFTDHNSVRSEQFFDLNFAGFLIQMKDLEFVSEIY